MDFNEHSALEGLHAFLSPSQYHWVNYDEQKIVETYKNYRAKEKGVILHDFARQAIKLGQKLPGTKKSLNAFVNDAIGYKMIPEQVLYFSPNAFGTADAISFRKDYLRIHDLKTGVTKAYMKQLEVYTALFCMEYKHNPNEIEVELRIYQLDEVVVHVPPPEDILYIMGKILDFDATINRLRLEN